MLKPLHYILAAGIGLAACDGGASAVLGGGDDGDTVIEQTIHIPADPRADAIALNNGLPLWSSNARYTAEENAAYHFERDGAEFGAATLEEFVGQAHAFVSAPPEGAEVITRANGDRLIYDPHTNTFAVATREGAPRTIFKPDDGAAYWEKQKKIEADKG